LIARNAAAVAATVPAKPQLARTVCGIIMVLGFG
jgi:hypothetical protein